MIAACAQYKINMVIDGVIFFTGSELRELRKSKGILAITNHRVHTNHHAIWGDMV